MPIAYAAHTETCTFLLDEAGICRQIIRRAAAMRRAPRGEDGASRCIGAQYVASIDVTAEGLLAAMPKIGAPMLFAYVAPGGHIALVRTGNVTKFEAKGRPVPEETARQSGVVPRPPAPRPGSPTLPGPDESSEVALDRDDFEDPTALFSRKPAAMWLYDTSPPPAIPVRRIQPSEPEIPPPPRVPHPTDTAPTLERRPARRGMLPTRRRA